MIHCKINITLTLLFVLFLSGNHKLHGQNINWADGFNTPGVNNLISTMDADSQYVYTAGTFTAITNGLQSYKLARYDGKAWQNFTDTVNGPKYPLEIKVRNGVVWVADTRGVLKYDGNGWTLVGSTINQSVFDLDFDAAGNLYVVGQFTSINGMAISGIAKYNGVTWSGLGSGVVVNSLSDARAVQCLGNDVYVSGPFTNAGGVACSGLAKWNGSNWSAINTGGFIFTINTFFCEVNNEVYVSALSSTSGFNPLDRVFKIVGQNAVQIGGSFNGAITHLRWVENRLHAIGSFTQIGNTTVNRLAYWDGTNWMDSGGDINFDVFDIASNSNFTMAGGNSTPSYEGRNYNYVALRKFNSPWITSGYGMNGTVQAVLATDDYVYVAGSFTEAGGIKGRVVRWDGIQWDTLNGGLAIKNVKDIAIYKDTIYIGGSFTDPQTLSGVYIAKWNGSTWVEVDGGMNYDVYTLEVYNNELYAGGLFTATSSGPANQIAKYDGSVWTNLSSLTNGIVRDIKFDQNGNMYVAGNFTTIGGTQARRIAKFDGVNWSEVGSGVDGFVNTICITPANELYIGGAFNLGYNVGPLNHIAKFNGVALQGVNNGLGTFSDAVYDLHYLCGKLYATGIFKLNGIDSLNNIAVNDGSGWMPLGKGLQHDTAAVCVGFAMDAQSNRLWVGGNFCYAGGKRADKIVYYAPEGVSLFSINTLDGCTCSGDTLTFVFSGANFGLNPQYQWYVNDVLVPNSNDTILVLPSVNDGDEIYVVVTTNPLCGQPSNLRSPSYFIHLTSLNAPLVMQNVNTFSISNPELMANNIWQISSGLNYVNIAPFTSGNTYQASIGGQYRVRAIKGTCARTSNMLVATSVNELSEDNVVAFPNPVTSQITIMNIEKYKKVEIRDLSGKLIFNEFLNHNSESTIPTGSLAQGLYVITLFSELLPPATLWFAKE